jgi:transcriptional regulator with XRE-family HTH domain
MAWDLRQLRRNLHLTQKQMAVRLGMSKSHYQILESPRGFVPEPLPLPDYIADRLKAIKREQMARSQVRKMPDSHCPLHNCRLAKARESWLWRLRGKMKRWWAKCVVGGELYAVRSDGVVRCAPRWKPGDLRPEPGRPANRRALFIDAQRLRKKKPTPTWTEITRKLDPQGFTEDQGRAAERLRIGVQNLKKRAKRTSPELPKA